MVYTRFITGRRITKKIYFVYNLIYTIKELKCK